MFFWLVTNRRAQKSSKLVIWLNGGPGCSSADGYFLESGPLRFVDNKLTINKGGWHEFANIVFLDQPIGTGLSYTSQPLDGDLGEVTNHFLAFLKAFFTIFPERAQDDLYLAGESYAGTYIPYFAKGVLDYNEKQVPLGEMAFNLKGLAIGNGWIDPLHQYTSYIPYVEQHRLSTPDLIDKCLDDIRMQDRITQDKCEGLVGIILQHSITDGPNAEEMCMNQYDTRRKDQYPACGLLWPAELPQMKTYLTRKDVLTALHADGADAPWTECNGRVSSALRFDDSVPAVALLPDILDKIGVLLFSGDQDLICNHIGTEYLISNMTWQGIQGFQDTPKVAWTVEDKPAGEWMQDRNLAYVLLYNASHMVPYDVPLAALDMMNRFMGLDPTLQSFTSRLETDPVRDGGGGVEVKDPQNLPSGGEKVDIDQPENLFSTNGSAVLLFVLMAVGVGIFVVVRNNQRRKNVGGGHDGIQWFPLSTNGSGTRGGHRSVHTDELDELVVESGIRESDDEDDSDDPFDTQDRSGHASLGQRR
ncbi:Cell death protease [Mortierella claussenii]|nr:Cell death protease [Mortierella claussenii]